jgi:radical SAM superfamily enzyme YgiQ (UPF0313 family)
VHLPFQVSLAVSKMGPSVKLRSTGTLKRRRKVESKIWLINPSNVCAGFGGITPRWLPIIAAATPAEFADRLILIDEAIEQIDSAKIRANDLVAFSVHTLNARRAYEKVRKIKATCGATLVVGGVHATIFPQEVLDQGADAVITGDGDLIWAHVVSDFFQGRLQKVYQGGKIAGQYFIQMPRWDLLKHERYLMASVHTTRGCPENCSFCSVWVTDGRQMRIRTTDDIIAEINLLYALGFRFFILADDNFYAVGKKNQHAFEDVMAQRYELMDKLATQVPRPAKFFTQTTIRTADDPPFLRAMRHARIRGALVGVESVDVEGLASINKEFNKTGQDLIDAIARMQEHRVYVLGSYIVGLESDTQKTFETMLQVANASQMALAQFVRYTPFPGTVDWSNLLKDKLAIKLAPGMEQYWLLEKKAGRLCHHPHLQTEEIEEAIKLLWNGFYSTPQILKRAKKMGLRKLAHVLPYFLVSKIYKKIYYEHGLAADSVRTTEGTWITKLLGEGALRLFKKERQALPPSR